MGVLTTITLDAQRLTEADIHDDGSVRLWAGRGMTGAQAWGLKPREVERLYAGLTALMGRPLHEGADGYLEAN